MNDLVRVVALLTSFLVLFPALGMIWRGLKAKDAPRRYEPIDWAKARAVLNQARLLSGTDKQKQTTSLTRGGQHAEHAR